MIYATIDVDLAVHDKAIAAGPAMYLWTWGMLVLRKNKSSTGFIPTKTAHASPWGEPAVNKRAAAKLAEVGLWIPSGGGWTAWNYVKKNDTLEVIEARIAARVAGQQAYRDRKKTGALPVTVMASAAAVISNVTGNAEERTASAPARIDSVVTDNVTHNVTDNARAFPGAGAGALVVSSDLLLGVQGGPPPADDPRPVSLDEPITPGALARVEAMAIAIGFRPSDVTAEWLKYLGKIGSKWPRSQLESNWQNWLVDAKRYAAKERARDAAGALRGRQVQQGIDPSITAGKEF